MNKWYIKDSKTKRFDASGHKFVHKEGVVDVFAYFNGNYCNGPVCAVCGYAACWHCEQNPPKCKGKQT